MRRLAMLTGAVLAAAWVLAPTPVRAVDFYLLFEKCKLLVGYLVQSDESLKVFDGDKTLLRCTRTSQKIRCRFEFAALLRRGTTTRCISRTRLCSSSRTRWQRITTWSTW